MTDIFFMKQHILWNAIQTYRHQGFRLRPETGLFVWLFAISRPFLCAINFEIR